jgi:hypothetical protein
MKIEKAELDEANKVTIKYLQEKNASSNNKIRLQCDGCHRDVVQVIMVDKGSHMIFYEGVNYEDIWLLCKECGDERHRPKLCVACGSKTEGVIAYPGHEEEKEKQDGT